MVARKLTIVQILPALEEGGVEGETVDLALYLARQGHRSIVISGGGRLVPLLEKNGCFHIHWPAIGSKNITCLPYFFKLRKYLSNNRIDIVHLRSRLPAWIGYLAWKSLPKVFRPSLVTSFHGFYSINSYSKIMTRGERVIAVSATIRQHILEHYSINASKITLIHGGFSVEEFNPEKIDKKRIAVLRQRWLGEHQGKKVVILPGRLTSLKGQEILIKSIALLKNRDVVCLLIGDTRGNPLYTKKLEELIEKSGLKNQVIMTGHCDDMPAALLLADVVVSASSSQPEAFGKVMVEAMAMKRAVIATAHGGSLETVVDGENGWLVPPGDPEAMAIALEKALADSELCRRFGEAGRERVLSFFTADVMYKKTVELYYHLYQQRKRSLQKDRLTVMQLLPELNSGGIERGTLEMGRYLVQKGFTSLVVSGGGRLVNQLEKEGTVHIRRQIGIKGPQVLWHILPMRRLLLKKQVDILHLRSRMPAWVGYLAWRLLPKSKRPVLLTTFHGFYSVNRYSAIMTKGTGVIAVSQKIQDHIVKNYGRSDRVRRIFRGVDEKTFAPELITYSRIQLLLESWKLKPSLPIIALPGRLSRWKGQDFFIRSLALIKDMQYQAVLIGDVNDNPLYTEELKQLVTTSGLSERVHFAGHCVDMPAAFFLADIVVSASSSEPEAFGRTTVEAMAMCCPVIATAHGGSLETVVDGENGWLVPPGDEISLAQTLREVLTLRQERPEELRAMGMRNCIRVKKYFSAKVMCQQTIDFYWQLFDEKYRL